MGSNLRRIWLKMLEETNLLFAALKILKEAGIPSENPSIHRLAKGANNQTFKLQTASKAFIIKKYFENTNDLRNRLYSEYSFLTFANISAKKFVPSIYGKSSESRLAVYEYVEGTSVKAEDLNYYHIRCAIDFFCQLNKYKEKGQFLPHASEACFSILDHFDIVDKRLNQILSIDANHSSLKEAKIIAQELNNFWQKFKNGIIYSNSFDLTSSLSHEQRCISPSDFGFHNAIIEPNLNIRFIDFEYAGWDDPAKMIGDFFSQVSIPINEKYFDEFAEKTLIMFPDSESLYLRSKILRVVCQIKWMCIVLNIFIPHHLARRKFADPALNEADLFENQINKAKKILISLKDLGDLYAVC